MTQEMTNPETLDEVLVRFLKEIEGVEDGESILRSYCRRHPDLAAEIRSLGATHRLLDLSAADGDAGHPDRLGDFRIIRPIGHGGMGMIYEAVQEPFGRRVAVKTIRGRRLSDSAQARFLASRRSWPGCTTPTSCRSTPGAAKARSSISPCPTSRARR